MQFKSPYVEVHVFREKGKRIEFLVLKRSADEIFPNVWQMVTGKIRDGEKAYETGIRELKEETGLIPLRMWTAPNVNSFYNHQNDTMNLLPVFVCQVSVEADVVISDEHSAFDWVEVDDASKLFVWEGQRQSVRIIFNYLSREREALNLTEIKIKFE